jgi:hypothetical protein
MKTTILALLGALATACSPATVSGPDVHTATSSSAALTRYGTFSFGLAELPRATYQASSESLEVERRMRELISSALQQKGYVEDDSKPNFLVRFGVGAKTLSRPLYDSDPGWLPDDNVETQRIDVDIYDADAKTEVWNGSAISEHNLNQRIDNGLLQRDVQGLFATFPARSSAGDSAAKPVAVAQGSSR